MLQCNVIGLDHRHAKLLLSRCMTTPPRKIHLPLKSELYGQCDLYAFNRVLPSTMDALSSVSRSMKQEQGYSFVLPAAVLAPTYIKVAPQASNHSPW